MTIETRQRHRSSLRLAEVLLIVAVILAFAAFSLPYYQKKLFEREQFQLISNTKQIFLANFQMSADYMVDRDPHQGWPGDLVASHIDPVRSLPEWVERLITYDYIRRHDVAKLFAAPGVATYPGSGSFESKYSPYKIYLVKESDPSNCLFIATKNFTFGKGLDAKAMPYGARGAFVFRKGGDGVFVSARQSLVRATVGELPRDASGIPPTDETSRFWE